jgi:DnaJ-class molecular chaperone
MGIGGLAVTPEDLRARYRTLMMRHHPDVDPSGLERCKDVNVAYSLLIRETSTRT